QLVRPRLLLCLVAWSLPGSALAQEVWCPPISGQVLAQEDGAPIAGARISIEGLEPTTLSGPDGSFGFDAPSPCEALVIAEGAGRERLEVDVAPSDAPRVLRLHMAPAGRYQATVTAPRLTAPTAT